MESKELEDQKRAKDAAVGGVTAMAVVGVVAGVASLMLKRR